MIFPNSKGFQNGDPKAHFQIPKLELFYSDLDVGCLYEIETEQPII